MTSHLELSTKDIPRLIESGARAGAERVLNLLVDAYGRGDSNEGFAHVWTQGSLIGLTLSQLAFKADVSSFGVISADLSLKIPTRVDLDNQFMASDRCVDCKTRYTELLDLATPFFLISPDDLVTAEAYAEAWFQDWLANGA